MERVAGQRIYKEYEPDFHYYITDPRGTHKSMYGDSLKKISPRTFAEKQKSLKTLGSNSTTWESDIDPVVRCLEQNYKNADLPNIHVAFFDIETSFDKELGWSEAGEAKNYITSISVYLQWMEEIICLALPPETLTKDEAQAIADEVGNVILFDTEMEMLQAFIAVIQDADVLSSWNGTMYDIPYTINRIKRTMGKQETRKLCLWDQEPKARSIERGGKESPTYDLIGRVHMDYMELYKKYNYEERHSYALNAIAEAELGDHKVAYDGTLDELYNDDFKKFLEYNIQDTMLLNKLDRKLQFIELASAIAHGNCVSLPTVMGAVAVTDQAVMMEAHERGMIARDRRRSKNSRAAGGWVASPKKGLHKWVGSEDMKSLYPSIIRAMNASNETIIGQIRTTDTDKQIADWEAKGAKYTFANWWNDRFNVLEMEYFYNNDKSEILTIDFENGETLEVTGAELRDIIFNSNQHWCISANGTIFRTDKEGIIPGLLARWYSERKVLQKKAEDANLILSGIDIG